jgi:hypothetical protein
MIIASRYNAMLSGLMLDQEGSVIRTTIHGIVRYERTQE